MKKYRDYRSRNLVNSNQPLLISNVNANETPINIKNTIKNILSQHNITGSVVIITNYEPVPVETVVSKYEIDPSPYHHPYFYNSDQNGHLSNANSVAVPKFSDSQNPYANLVFPVTPITFSDIPTIVVIANSLMSVYNYFETFIPSNDTLSTNTSGTSSASSILAQIQNALIMYAKIRYLSKTFSNKQSQISQQVSFLGSHLTGLQTTEIDMINFNGLDSQYFTLKTSWLVYQNDTRASKIISDWSSISIEAINFRYNINQIVNFTSVIIEMAQKFESALTSLNLMVQSNARKLGLLDVLNSPALMSTIENSVSTSSGLLGSLANSSMVQDLENSSLAKSIENSSVFKSMMNSSIVQSLTGGRNPIKMLENFDKFMMALVSLTSNKQKTSNSLNGLVAALDSFKVRHDNLVLLLGHIQSQISQLETQDLLKKKVWIWGTVFCGLLMMIFK